jgi:hypothetical protein
VRTFRLDSPQIVTADLDRVRTRAEAGHPRAARFVHTALPGYSADRTTAVVVLTNVLNAHPSGDVVGLRYARGKWLVSDVHHHSSE